MVDHSSKKLKVEENCKVNISEKLVLSLEKLEEVQDELLKINEKHSDEVLKMEQKFNEMRKLVYDKRNEIIKSLPSFWLHVFMGHPVLYEILNYEDQKMFRYMTSLEVKDDKDVGYSITFNFDINPYFENRKLTKAFTILEDGKTKITTTPVIWKEGKEMLSGVDSDKKKNKQSDLYMSFFRWFNYCKPKDDMHDIHDEVAELIKNDLWPNPLSYFCNEDEEDSDDEVDDEESDEDNIEEKEEDENKDEDEL